MSIKNSDDLKNYLKLKNEIIDLELKLHETIRELDILKKHIDIIIHKNIKDTNIVCIDTNKK